jgi:hypothetical protein
MIQATKNQQTLSPKTAELLSYTPHISTTFADTYIFEPSESEEDRGKLYIVIEIEHKGKTAKEIADAIATIMQNEYYGEETTIDSIDEHFEQAINKTNEILGDLAQQGETSWVGKIHAIIAVLHDQTLYLTKTGNAKALLLRNTQAIDVSENLNEQQDDASFRTFTNVASGGVELGDKIIFATPALFQHIPFEQLYKSIQQYSPSNATTRLQALLQTKRLNHAVGALVSEMSEPTIDIDDINIINSDISTNITINKEELPGANNQDTAQPLPQVNNPHTNEQETDFRTALEKEQIKEPEEPRNQITQDKPTISEAEQEYSQYEQKDLSVSTTHSAKRTPLQLIKTIGATAAAKINGIAIPFIQKITRREPKQDHVRLATQRQHNKPSVLHMMAQRLFSIRRKKQYSFGQKQTLVSRFKQLPLVGKILLTAIIPTIIMFAFVASNASNENKLQEEQAANQERITQVENLFEQARLALIIGDQAKAAGLLNEANALQSDIQPSDTDQQRFNQLQNDIQVQFDKLNKVIKVEHVPVIAQLNQPDTTTSLIATAASLFAFDSSTNSIFKIDPQTKQAQDLRTSSQNIGHLQYAAYMDRSDEVIFFTDTPGVAAFSEKSNSLTNKTIALLYPDQTATDIRAYSSRIYLLDTDNNQIISHISTSSGFGKGAPWIKDNSSVANAVAMAIDGDVYVLNTDGTIMKFLSGNRQQFTLEALQTPMKSPTDIYTNENLDEIYVADPENSRILIFNKNGSLINQLVNNDFAAITSIAVGEENKQKVIYVLSAGNVLSIAPDSIE